MVNLIVHRKLGKYPMITNARKSAEYCQWGFYSKKNTKAVNLN